MPFTKENEDMPKMGWVKEITFDWINETRDGRFIKTTYYASADMFPCQRCHTSDFVWLQLAPTGLLWACWGCKVVTGAMTGEVLEVIDRKEVSIEEAFEIAKKQADFKKLFPPERIAMMERKKKQLARLKRRRQKRK